MSSAISVLSSRSAPVLVVVCALAVGSCGGTNHAVADATKGPLAGDGDDDRPDVVNRWRTKPDIDGDADNEGSDHYDWDDSNVFDFGHLAGVAEAREITKLVAAYYRATLRGDGAVACKLLAGRVTRSVQREFGQGASSLAVGGRTCTATMSMLLPRLRPQFSISGSSPTVGLVRVEGERGEVLVTTHGALADRFVPLFHEQGVWKVNSLLDIGLP
jgi:hypothetical protein